MKYFGFFLLILFASCQKRVEQKDTYIKTALKPSKIDSLDTPEKVEAYVRSIDSSWKDFTLRKFQDFKIPHKTDSIAKILAKKMNVNETFYKADFDNNTYQDILIIGDKHTCSSTAMEGSCSFDCFVIMNFGLDSIRLIDFVRNDYMIVPQIISKDNNKPLLKITDPYIFRLNNEIIKDSSSAILTYKFDDFIEYNKQPVTHSIESIEFSTSGCIGPCPVYKLTIKKDKSATFLAKVYNFNILAEVQNFNMGRDSYAYAQNEGFFKGKIKEVDYNKLINTLNYIDFNNLKDEYSVSWKGDQTGELKITYDNGKVKKIDDYGMVGTYGLKAVYQQLADLRFNQDWQEVQ